MEIGKEINYMYKKDFPENKFKNTIHQKRYI